MKAGIYKYVYTIQNDPKYNYYFVFDK